MMMMIDDPLPCKAGRGEGKGTAWAAQALPLLPCNGCEHLLPHDTPYGKAHTFFTLVQPFTSPASLPPPWPQVGQLEAQLFEHFFSPTQPAGPGAPPGAPGNTNGHHGSWSNGSDSTLGAGAGGVQQPGGGGSGHGSDKLVPVMEPLCGVLYDVLRPLVVQLQDIDELCELVDILKHEVGVRAGGGGEGLERRGGRVRDLEEGAARACGHPEARGVCVGWGEGQPLKG